MALVPVPAALGAVLPGCERVSLGSSATQLADASYASSLSSFGRIVAYQSARGSGSARDVLDVYVRDLTTGISERVSRSSTGANGDADSVGGSLSADGRLVAFQSLASDLVTGDGNAAWDVFVRDRAAKRTTRVSVSSAGAEGDGASYAPVISADGSVVAFASAAESLVPGDANGRRDVFVRDLGRGTTERVSVAASGGSAGGESTRPSVSADGRFVAFESNARDLISGDTNGRWDVFVRDRLTGRTLRASTRGGDGQANGDSGSASISADGRYVAFVSSASDLVAGDRNGVDDVFVKDLLTGTTTRVSVAVTGRDADGASDSPSIAADGSVVAFRSSAGNIVAGDTNGWSDTFVRDVAAGTTRRVSVASSGAEGDGPSRGGALSPEGRYVAFDSDAADLVTGDSNGVADVFRAQASDRRVARVAGDSRYDTAVEASRRAFPFGAETVVLATGRNWPDALGGSALAGAVRGPVLLTDPARLPEPTSAELERLAPKRVYVLGASSAVATAVLDAVSKLSTRPKVTRLGGRDRYRTADLVASEVVAIRRAAFDGRVLVTTGADYPDALAASPVAYARSIPVVLARPGSTAPALPRAASSAVVLGGRLAVGAAAYDALAAKLGSTRVRRISGATRYATAAGVAKWGAGLGLVWDGVALSTGENFPDALAGGAMSGRLGSVMLLTRTATLSRETASALAAEAGRIGSVRVLGKSGAVADEVVTQTRSALGD